MGAWKNILIEAEEGNREAMKTVAGFWYGRKDYAKAFVWFERGGDMQMCNLCHKHLTEKDKKDLGLGTEEESLYSGKED